MKRYVAAKWRWGWMVGVVVVIVVGCGREPEPAARPEMAATVMVNRVTAMPTEIATVVASATAAATIEPTALPTVTPSAMPSPTAMPTTTPTATAVPTLLPAVTPPAGLVYQTVDGLWMVDDNSQPLQLSDKPNSLVLPDGRGILYIEDEDIWFFNQVTGEARNLTQTDDSRECCVQWSAGRPDQVIFRAYPENPAPTPLGYLASVSLTANDYQVFVEAGELRSPFALSPDGQTVAYAGGGNWLLQWDSERQPILVEEYGFVPMGDSFYLNSPAWSPDGKQLAWMASSRVDNVFTYQVALFDLETKVARFLHPYTPPGSDASPANPVWSKDGQWLVIADAIWEQGPAGERDWLPVPLWVIRTDGPVEEYALHIDPLEDPATGWDVAWSPDGRWLAFSPYRNDYAAVWVAEVGTWQVYRVPLPGEEGATVKGWLTATP